MIKNPVNKLEFEKLCDKAIYFLLKSKNMENINLAK